MSFDRIRTNCGQPGPHQSGSRLNTTFCFFFIWVCVLSFKENTHTFLITCLGCFSYVNNFSRKSNTISRLYVIYYFSEEAYGEARFSGDFEEKI